MSNISKKRTFGTISLGVLSGAVIFGGAQVVWANRDCDGNFNLPYRWDKVKTYGVTTEEFSIEELLAENNVVVEEPSKKEYLSEFDILGMNNSLEVSSYSPWGGTDSTGVFERETSEKTIRQYYRCTFDRDSLTEEQKREKIEFFQNGEIEKVIEDCDWERTEKEEAKVLTKEELEKDTYSTKLVVSSIDYNDTHFNKESKMEYEDSNFNFQLMTIVGAAFGFIAGFTNLCFYEDRLERKQQEKEETKKYTKKK